MSGFIRNSIFLYKLKSETPLSRNFFIICQWQNLTFQPTTDHVGKFGITVFSFNHSISNFFIGVHNNYDK